MGRHSARGAAPESPTKRDPRFVIGPSARVDPNHVCREEHVHAFTQALEARTEKGERVIIQAGACCQCGVIHVLQIGTTKSPGCGPFIQCQPMPTLLGPTGVLLPPSRS